MWQWLKELWGPTPKKIVLDLSEDLESEVRRDPYREAAPGGEDITPAVKEEPSLVDIIRGAAQEVAEEQVKLEQRYLKDDYLRSYFQKSMKFIFSQINSDSYDFVLVHDHDAGVATEAFGIFSQIFVKACTQIGIKAKAETTYVNVDKASVKKFLKTIETKTPRVDIDEKVRAMLGS